jgi:HK97 family phage major capsid protein
MDPSRMGQSAGVTLDGLSFRATTFDTAAATLTEYDRQPPMVLVGQQQLTVADLLAQGQTNANTIRYVQEDTFTNAATATSEGATKPEAAWDTSEVDAPVRKIAVVSKVTDELFSDFPAMASYIDVRMRFMVAQVEETELLTGSGSAPHLRGLLNASGIQTQAKGADNGPDAVFKALVKVQSVGYFPPDGIIQHPTDWQNVRLLKDANGNYIFGPPGLTAEPRMWGYPVVVTTAITLGTTLVGAFKLAAQIFYREGLRVESTNTNEDDFKTNKIAIRAEQREALAIYRPKALCTVTGL